MVNNMTDLTAQEPAWQTRDHLDDPVIGELRNRFGPDAFTVQATRTGVPVVWIKREQLLEVGDFLKKLPKPYVMLFDLHGMDERLRTHREGLPAADFSVFYHLISIDRNRDIMLKVALAENDLHVPTFTKLFPNANWYERETWDLFGITFDGHPNLRRIMMPQTWKGHPLRKDYPARATEFSPFELTKAKQDLEMEALTFKPEEWGDEARHRKRGLHVPQPRSEPPVGARGFPYRFTTRRRRDCRLRTRHRLPPPWCGENGRAPVLAQLHSVYRPY